MKKLIELIKENIVAVIFDVIITPLLSSLLSEKVSQHFNIIELSFKIILWLVLCLFIFLVILLLEVTIISIINSRKLSKHVKNYISKFNAYESKISDFYHSDNKASIESNQIILKDIENCVDILYEIIPDKIKNDTWNEITHDFLQQINRARIETLAKQCKELLDLLFEKNKNLKIDSKALEKLEHIFDNLELYSRN